MYFLVHQTLFTLNIWLHPAVALCSVDVEWKFNAKRGIFRLICLKPVCPACFYCATEELWCHQVIAPLELRRSGFRASPWWPAQLSTLATSFQIAVYYFLWMEGKGQSLIHRHFWAPRGVRCHRGGLKKCNVAFWMLIWWQWPENSSLWYSSELNFSIVPCMWTI